MTARPGHLSYGPLMLTRQRTCVDCQREFASHSGRGTVHTCPECHGGEKWRERKNAADRIYRKRKKGAGK